MSYKRSPICGITIKPYYLDPELLQVSRMTVSQTPDCCLIWTVLPDSMVFDNQTKAHLFATKLCKIFKVRAYIGYAKGRELSITEYEYLERRGLLAHLL